MEELRKISETPEWGLRIRYLPNTSQMCSYWVNLLCIGKVQQLNLWIKLL